VKTLKKVLKIMGVLTLVYCAYFFYTFNASVKEIKSVCSKIQPGLNKQEAINLIETSRHLRYIEMHDTETDKQTLIILSNANLGRHTCSVEVDGKTVTGSKHVYAD